jgi:phage baseplate assembly protein W
MSNIVDKYVIDFPFNLSTYKKVAVIKANDPNVYRNKIRALFSTGTDERVWYHSYGANLTDLLFEPSAVAVEDARNSVSQVFASWVPEVTLLDLTAGFDDRTGSVTLNVTYQIPSGDVDTIKIANTSLTTSGDSPDQYTEQLASENNG